jgi:hypothetical protein
MKFIFAFSFAQEALLLQTGTTEGECVAEPRGANMAYNKSLSPSPTSVERAELVLQLVPVDTAYADLYRFRARQLAASELSAVDFRALKLAEEGLHSIPGEIQRAMDERTWEQVQKLTQDLRAKQRLLEDRGSVRKIGESLYEDNVIYVDPFSPGFCWYHRREERELGSLRDAALGLFGQAARIDPEWKRLYEDRQRDLKTVRLTEPSGSEKPRDMEQRAREALASGKFDELERLAASIHAAGSGSAGSTPIESTVDVEPAPLAFGFTPETLQKARALGLEPEHFDNVRARFRSLFPYLWRPVFFESDANLVDARVTAMLPKDTPDALRDRIVMLVTRPILTSGGARFLPPLVEEDVLVETFEEGPAMTEVGKNGLAEALGLRRRWGLNRLSVERIIQTKGPELVKSLGLDPWSFRLVCMPPDLFGPLGEKRNWGKQEIWTHLDGFVATRERKLLALAGGDVRYGGVQDLVGVGVGYDSDRLLARFAVVDRRRLRAW